jgi:hypothetical protein
MDNDMRLKFHSFEFIIWALLKAVFANFRRVWKWLAVPNTLAYKVPILIIAIKSDKVQPP